MGSDNSLWVKMTISQKDQNYPLQNQPKGTILGSQSSKSAFNYRAIFPGLIFGARVNVDIDSDSSGYWDQ